MKLRTILLFINCALLIIHCQFAFAQTWEPVGPGITSWDTNELPVYTLCEYNGKLYAGGTFHSAGKLKANNIASWDGKNWDTLSIGTNGLVKTMCVYKNALCVGGGFTKAGRKKANTVAEWVDTARTTPAWYLLGGGLKYSWIFAEPNGYSVCDFSVYQDQLYAVGYFNHTGDGRRANFIAKWNGYKWNKVGKVIYKYDDNNDAFIIDTSGGGIGDGYTLMSSVVFHNELYVSIGNASFSQITEKNNLYKWDGIKWDAVETGITDKNKMVANTIILWTMVVYDSALYVDGMFNNREGKPVHKMAKWDGKSWSVLTEGISKYGTVRSMVVYNGKLYVGGIFDSAGGKPAKSIACWDGHEWSAVGAGLSTGKYPAVANVNALCVYKGELYAGGSFTSSGGKTVMNIARLNVNATKPASNKSKK